MDTILMLPTYNERENLENLVREIISTEPRVDILIIDDSSPDGTGEIANRLSSEFDRIKVVHRPPKSGRGTASQYGYKYAIDNKYEYYVEMDVDHSHNPGDLPKILNAAHDADMVIASRFVAGGGVEGWNWKRKLLHWGADVAVKLILGTPNTDHTNGYRCYSVATLAKIDFSRLKFGGYVEHTILENVYHKAGFTIKEVPSVFRKRHGGDSKMGKKEMIDGIVDMIKFRWNLLHKGVNYYLNP